MSQFLMLKKRDDFHLQYALDNYEFLNIRISPFSLGNETRSFAEEAPQKLSFVKNKKDGLIFLTDHEIVRLPLKDYKEGFKVEYQDNIWRRLEYLSYNHILPEYYDGVALPFPTISCLRNVIDDFLIEIRFKGKIDLEFDEQQQRQPYYKMLIKK